jgi:two-component system, NtrC family, sensor histidine kinase HydH
VGRLSHAIAVAANGDLEGDFDPSLVQQALLNLVLNAVDACKPGDAVMLRAAANGDGATKIDVIDPAGPIPGEMTAQLFEPFFTTKPHGTGLGLAIARNIARAHRGDLVLSVNEPARVCFSLELPGHSGTSCARAETHDGQNTGRR